MGLTIRTNNVPRFTVPGYELTTKEFDYYNDAQLDEATFFRYKGYVLQLI